MTAAAAALKRGGVVAFPTETVYGLAVRYGDRRAQARLARLKNRQPGKPFQVLLSSRQRVRQLCGQLPEMASKLARAYWPGPLTLVVRNRSGRWIGLRVPDHPVARELARRAGGALAATSANLSGRRPALAAKEVLEAFDAGVDLVLDGGPVAIGEASSVVRVSRRHWQMLREEAIAQSEIENLLGSHTKKEGIRQ